MFDPRDQWNSDDVKVREFYIFDWYKELYWPLLSDVFHVFIGQLIVGLQLLLAFIPECGDVDKVPICTELR
jgi:hypothetical protein